jgi:nitrate/TMAO reductase-like tetraheme cytochrome c subunit
VPEFRDVRGRATTPTDEKGRGRVLVGLALAAAVAAPTGWLVTDRLEQDDDFCNACHLPSGPPLHEQVRADFDATEPVVLASLHGAAEHDGRDFRCIDCHGGVSFAGRVRVKALAGLDALVYLTGRFEEPHGMAWPLWDEDCTQCHASFDESPGESWNPRFHELPVHNTALGVGCVECHLSHETGGNPQAHFLVAESVRFQCARCHSEYEEEERP